MNKLFNNNKNGFTIMELIVYITIFVIAIVLIMSFILNLIKVQAKSRIKEEVLNNSQRAMDIMTWEIRHAQSIYNATSAIGSHPGQLSIKTQKNILSNETETYVDFYLDNNRLCIKREKQEEEFLTSENIEITNLIFNSFTAGNSQAIQINLTTIYNQPGGKTFDHATTTLTTTAILRNE